jgi:hypothetical protein
MANTLWKVFERRVSAMFGCKRNILSGSCGRDDKTASDTTHPELFIEIKHFAKKWAFIAFYDKAVKLAKKEKKLPILVLGSKGVRGAYVVVHTSHLARFAEIILANKDTVSAEFDQDQGNDCGSPEVH